MERELLLLGLLRTQAMYGYQLNEMIDSHLGTSIQLKKPTAYNLLDKMTDEGWVTYREEQEGNRPPRYVYSITPHGEAAFQRLLRKCLADYKPTEFRSDISLAFLEALSREEAAFLLSKRRTIIQNLLEQVNTEATQNSNFQVIIEHHRRHLEMELEWLEELMAKLK